MGKPKDAAKEQVKIDMKIAMKIFIFGVSHTAGMRVLGMKPSP